MSQSKRTRIDLLLQLMNDLGDTRGPLLRERFKREIVPLLKRGPSWDAEMSEEEYQAQLARLRLELPNVVFCLEHSEFLLPPYHRGVRKT